MENWFVDYLKKLDAFNVNRNVRVTDAAAAHLAALKEMAKDDKMVMRSHIFLRIKII